MRHHYPFVNVAALLAIVAACSWLHAGAAGLYRCTASDGAVMYATGPCAGMASEALSIDRAPLQAEALDRAPPVAAPAPPVHRLSAQERQRIVALRRADADISSEARTAAEIEIAAIREGADAQLGADERAARDRLRTQLAAADADARRAALREWQALYARHRVAPHPRIQPDPGALDRRDTGARQPFPEPPLGAGVPGTRGPLVATPHGPASSLPPRSGPFADPGTGQVLAPHGERLVDPLTGTMWLRSGRNYVDPLTGRIIPNP